LFGDFRQIPPVFNFPIYANTRSNDKIAVYKEFKEMYKVDVIERQSGEKE